MQFIRSNVILLYLHLTKHRAKQFQLKLTYKQIQQIIINKNNNKHVFKSQILLYTKYSYMLVGSTWAKNIKLR